MISSLYSALSRVSWHFCFHSCKTSQNKTFCNYSHEINWKFHVNHHYGHKALCYINFQSRNLRRGKKTGETLINRLVFPHHFSFSHMHGFYLLNNPTCRYDILVERISFQSWLESRTEEAITWTTKSIKIITIIHAIHYFIHGKDWNCDYCCLFRTLKGLVFKSKHKKFFFFLLKLKPVFWLVCYFFKCFLIVIFCPFIFQKHIAFSWLSMTFT